jgi:hypothetical protein
MYMCTVFYDCAQSCNLQVVVTSFFLVGYVAVQSVFGQCNIDWWGTQWRSRLRHCATSRKVTGLIPDGVVGISHWQNPFGRAVAPGVDSASNRNEYREYFLWGEGGRCLGLTTLPPSCADSLEIWEPQPPGTLRARPGL